MNQKINEAGKELARITLEINGRRFVPLSEGDVKDMDGFYKEESNGILLFDVTREPFVFVVSNARQGHFFVSCTRHGKGIRYLNSTTSTDEKRLGLDTLGYAATRALAESLPTQLKEHEARGSSFEIGQRVYVTDAAPFANGWYVVHRAETVSGRIETPDTIVTLCPPDNAPGDYIRVVASQLRESAPVDRAEKMLPAADLGEQARDVHARLAAAQDAWDQTHSEDLAAYSRLEAAREAVASADQALAGQKHDDCEVLQSSEEWRATLAVGGEVFWTDPDDGICSGYRVIVEIVSESGVIESDETVVRLTANGSVTEAFAGEISPLKPEETGQLPVTKLSDAEWNRLENAGWSAMQRLGSDIDVEGDHDSKVRTLLAAVQAYCVTYAVDLEAQLLEVRSQITSGDLQSPRWGDWVKLPEAEQNTAPQTVLPATQSALLDAMQTVDQLRRALEVIGVGDAIDPKAVATEALEETGIWLKQKPTLPSPVV